MHHAPCIKNGRRTAVSKNITLLYQWKKKPRKTTEEIDGQCKRTYGSKKLNVQSQAMVLVWDRNKWKTSSSSLIIIEMMEESSRRRRPRRHIMH